MTPFEEAADEARALLELTPPRPGQRSRLVGVDGPSGAGKSSFAALLEALVTPAFVVSGGDFYRPMPEAERAAIPPAAAAEGYFDLERLRSEVLEPLSTGQPAAYERYDWATHALGELVEVPEAELVVVEGPYVLHPSLRSYYDVTVWVDAPRDHCLEVMRERGDPPFWVHRWQLAEDAYAAETNPTGHCDLVVHSGRPRNPR